MAAPWCPSVSPLEPPSAGNLCPGCAPAVPRLCPGACLKKWAAGDHLTRRVAVGEPELAAEMPGRHMSVAGERIDVQLIRVLPIDPGANPA